MAFKRLLVAVDLSAHSGRALRLGVRLARACQASLQVVYVLEHGDPDEAAGLLAEFVASWTDASDLQSSVLQGTGAYAVMQEAAQSQVDLLVCGSQGKTGLTRLWLGSFAEKLVRMAGLPVLVVRQPPQDRLPGTLLVADDLSSAFSQVRTVASELKQRLAEEGSAEVAMLALHVAGPAGTDPKPELAADLAAHYPDWEKHVLAGRPAPVILDFAAEHQVELIVCGAHGKHGLPQFFLGSVAETLVRQATCSVLTVPEPDEADAEQASRWQAPRAVDADSRRLEVERGPD